MSPFGWGPGSVKPGTSTTTTTSATSGSDKFELTTSIIPDLVQHLEPVAIPLANVSDPYTFGPFNTDTPDHAGLVAAM
jgi:hypothetical protein